MDSNDKIIDIKVKDINPVGRHPEDILSNLCNNGFCLDGLQCGCMEAFLQSLSYKNEVTQRKVCVSDGREISRYINLDWQKDQTVWWKGHPYNRHESEYLKLVRCAFEEMYLWSARFRNVLMSTVGIKLICSNGNQDPFKTLLTDDEFCKILTQLRDSKIEDYKRYRYPRMWPNSYGVEEDYI